MSGKGKRRVGIRIDMTPMVDIVFFLLIFFLTTTMTAVQAVMNLPKPEKATESGGAARATGGELGVSADNYYARLGSAWIVAYLPKKQPTVNPWHM